MIAAWIRWLWGAFEQLRAMLAARPPADDCQQVDTTALPVKHTSRVRGPDGWTGPGNNLAARFGSEYPDYADIKVSFPALASRLCLQVGIISMSA